MSPKTRFNINGRGAYVDYRSSGLDLKNHGWEGNVFGSFQQTLPWDLRLSLNGGGGTPHISLQGKSSSFYYYAIGLSRSFLKEKRLTISLNSSNLFNKYITLRITSILLLSALLLLPEFRCVIMDLISVGVLGS